LSPKVNCVIANSLENFFQALFSPLEDEEGNINRFFKGKAKEKKVFWFRGHDSIEWKLQPTLYRKIITNNQDFGENFKDDDFWHEVKAIEEVIIDEFKVKNYHLMKSGPPDNTYLLFSLMQHHGLSTRLLDWSEQALTALFFALSSYFSNEKKGKVESIPCVWVLNPLRFQQWALNEYLSLFGKKDWMKSEIKNDYINSALNIDNNESIIKLYNQIPAPILTPYNSERIRAQSGVFTIFPIEENWCKKKNICSSNLCLEDMPNSDIFLLKIIIAAPKKISDQLKSIGYKRSNFFPEIPIVSSEIEEKYIRKMQK